MIMQHWHAATTRHSSTHVSVPNWYTTAYSCFKICSSDFHVTEVGVATHKFSDAFHAPVAEPPF